MVDGDANPIVEKGQDEYDFDSEFASTGAKSWGQRPLLRVRHVVDGVAEVDGLSVYQSPGELLAMTNTLLRVVVLPIDRLRVPACRQAGLIRSRLASWLRRPVDPAWCLFLWVFLSRL